jgi:hypothetical protein
VLTEAKQVVNPKLQELTAGGFRGRGGGGGRYGGGGGGGGGRYGGGGRSVHSFRYTLPYLLLKRVVLPTRVGSGLFILGRIRLCFFVYILTKSRKTNNPG